MNEKGFFVLLDHRLKKFDKFTGCCLSFFLILSFFT
jgi:hypothetical protein